MAMTGRMLSLQCTPPGQAQQWKPAARLRQSRGPACVLASTAFKAAETSAPVQEDEEQQAAPDVVSLARQHSKSAGVPATTKAPASGTVSDFMMKVKAAWRIFFPPRVADMTPKDAGKKRLRMILVADRCGMNQASLFEMKHSIVQVTVGTVMDYVDRLLQRFTQPEVVSEFVEIEGEELVDVNISADQDVGTIYTVNVPVRRVKPQARVPLTEGEDAEADGIVMQWDTSDPNADPSDRFPFGC